MPDPRALAGGSPLSGRYDPRKEWGGIRGSPCGDLALQRTLSELHATGPGVPAAVFPVPGEVGFADLADCQECPMCGGCVTHNTCLTDWAHLAWFAQFAVPGEPACGAEGVVAGYGGFTCDLRPGHGGDLHLDLHGNGWGRSAPGCQARPGQSGAVALLPGWR
jgi:hypothetical protein